MSIQDVPKRCASRVESSGFDRSVKFDTGADGVIVIDGAVDLDHRRARPTARSSCRSTIWKR